ncbi:PrsW family glutamic-type intramembrane protease [Anaerotignum sp.]
MLIEIASAPAAAGLFFLYIKDKYEKEPWKMLFLGLLFGLYTAAVVYAFGSWVEMRFPHEETPFYTAFFSSAGVEEMVKFLFLILLIWGNKNFNEPLDGIVYGVFVSLGFAWVENIIYVTHPVLGGYETALTRALLSVPGHGLFGIQMGYYLAQGKYRNEKRYLPWAFLAPYLAHGLYNYFLLEKEGIFWVFFAALEIWLWVSGMKKIKALQNRSPFRKKDMG